MKTRLLFLLIVVLSACELEDSIVYPDDPIDNNPNSPTAEWMYVRTKLEMHVGGVYYPNIEAPVVVKAFDANNAQQWQEQFVYSGPEENDLKLKTGFAKYTVTFTKWGKTLTQTFKGSDLWKDRVVAGNVPVTKVFQANAEPKRIYRTITSHSVPATEEDESYALLIPETKTTYSWDGLGKLRGMNLYTYNEETKAYAIVRFVDVDYQNNRVSKLSSYSADGTQLMEWQEFTYDEQGRTSHIKHRSGAAGITTDVALSYQFNDRKVMASYRLSNGGAFDYEMSLQHGNLKTDQTNRGSQLCSTGAFTADKSVNPLRHLGYTDYLLRNYSNSNRLTENVNYIACSFPTLVPESYEYTYDTDGYPLRSITHYKGTAVTRITDYKYEE